jgi:hypothetical protein
MLEAIISAETAPLITLFIFDSFTLDHSFEFLITVSAEAAIQAETSEKPLLD